MLSNFHMNALFSLSRGNTRAIAFYSRRCLGYIVLNEKRDVDWLGLMALFCFETEAISNLIVDCYTHRFFVAYNDSQGRLEGWLGV